MNKVLFQIGLLTFCISIIYLGVQEIPVIELLSRSFLIFVAVVAAGIFIVMSVRIISGNQHSGSGTPNHVYNNETKTK